MPEFYRLYKRDPDYLGALTMFDSQLGRLMGLLKSNNVYENTIIFCEPPPPLSLSLSLSLWVSDPLLLSLFHSPFFLSSLLSLLSLSLSMSRCFHRHRIRLTRSTCIAMVAMVKSRLPLWAGEGWEGEMGRGWFKSVSQGTTLGAHFCQFLVFGGRHGGQWAAPRRGAHRYPLVHQLPPAMQGFDIRGRDPCPWHHACPRAHHGPPERHHGVSHT